MRRTAIVLALAALSAAPVAAHAQRRRGGARPGAAATMRPEETLSPREAREALRSDDPERVIAAIDSLTVLGTPDVVPPIVELLRSGPPDRITDYAVEKLGIIGQPAAIEELSNLLHHRRPAVRRAAITALSRIRDDRVRPLIESGLHDSDSEVRGEAAHALGEIGARQSVGLLFRAFERGVPEAAESIGRLGDAATAVSPEAAWDREDPRATTHPHTLAMWLGRMPLSVLLRGFERYLNRSDISPAVKEQIIVRLEQQGSAQVREFLQQWVRSLPAGYRGRDRVRAELAIQQIRVPAGGAGGNP
jgi:HEAT repeat protein